MLVRPMAAQPPEPSAKKRSLLPPSPAAPEVRVRRIHRRDLNRVWEFLKICFRDVNRETVEYQRPRTKRRFVEVYEEEGVEQLLFETTIAKMRVFRVPEYLGFSLMLALIAMLLMFVTKSL